VLQNQYCRQGRMHFSARGRFYALRLSGKIVAHDGEMKNFQGAQTKGKANGGFYENRRDNETSGRPFAGTSGMAGP
ncbi:MAG: hypothetical protein WCP55_13820, partial [Lentisphaerota bacterium]